MDGHTDFKVIAANFWHNTIVRYLTVATIGGTLGVGGVSLNDDELSPQMVTKAEIIALQKDFDVRIDQLDNHIIELQAEVKSLKERIDRDESKIDMMHTDIKWLVRERQSQK